MKINELTVQYLGNSATEDDLLDFKTACEKYHIRHFIHTEQQAIDYIWNDGDFISRMMYWKSRPWA